MLNNVNGRWRAGKWDEIYFFVPTCPYRFNR